MISLVIPASTRTKEYTNALLKNIDEIYPNRDEVEVILQEDDSLTMGNNYNRAVERANGEKIILLHNDMILKPGFVEEMDRHIVRNRITTYTRVEPPIYTDTYPGKILLDCGSNLETFNKKKFEEVKVEESLVDGGTQLFFGCYKEDYIGIDGDTYKIFCEDDDFHLRCTIAGFERKVSSASVYHFVSKTSRTTDDYKEVESLSNKAFVKKWGFRNSQYNKCYKKSYSLINPNPQLENILEPWFNGGGDIIVKVNGNTFNEYDYQIIQNLNDIIADNGDIGEFELGNLQIIIKSLDSYEKDLIYLKKN
jgi:calcineurin-like phosphoesterase family protein